MIDSFRRVSVARETGRSRLTTVASRGERNNMGDQGTSKLQQLLSALRQLAYPKEFRINAAVWPPDLLSALEKLATAAPAPAANASEAGKTSLEDPAAPQKEFLEFLADLSTGLWRLRQKMVQPGTNDPLDEMRRAYRHLESTCDVLAEAGVQILDHTNELIPEGGIYALKTIAYQPTPGLTREHVIETIKPTVYYKNQMIQMGEVIIGTPEPNI